MIHTISRMKAGRHVRPLMGMALPLAAALAPPTEASTPYSNYIQGTTADITSIHGAILVRMDDNRVPTGCSGSGSPWMKINQTDTAMTSLVLAYWLQGKRNFVLYIDDWAAGYCTLSQADPDN